VTLNVMYWTVTELVKGSKFIIEYLRNVTCNTTPITAGPAFSLQYARTSNASIAITNQPVTNTTFF
jgi:hypothetical protein